ncbi:MAG: hypothetical protein V1723_04870 [Candidatus Uhrbacteria bacterium]
MRQRHIPEEINPPCELPDGQLPWMEAHATFVPEPALNTRDHGVEYGKVPIEDDHIIRVPKVRWEAEILLREVI